MTKALTLSQLKYGNRLSMNDAIIAALLSAFVYPGTGHFYLKQYNVGTLLSGISSIGFIYLLYQGTLQAQSIVDRIVSGELAMEMDIIYQQLTQISAYADPFGINIAIYSFVITWVVSVVDAYRLGKKQQSKQKGA